MGVAKLGFLTSPPLSRRWNRHSGHLRDVLKNTLCDVTRPRLRGVSGARRALYPLWRLPLGPSAGLVRNAG